MWSSELQQTIIQSCKTAEFRLLEPPSRHTSFRIGGPAAVMAFPKTTEELKQLLQGAAAAGAQPYILGAGTNILAPDEGLDALVICLKDALCGIRLLDEARIEAYAGESMAKAAVFAKNHALTGLEFAHGIPGTRGGGVYMNAGAYGGELKQVVESVTILTMDGEEKTLSGEECAFGYRTSVYQKLPCVIVKAVLQLHPGNPEEIGQTMRTRPTGYFAGPLIEQAGLKGCGVGGAEVSKKHAGFVVNTGGASADDVKKTIAMVQSRVWEASGVQLEPEVRIW